MLLLSHVLPKLVAWSLLGCQPAVVILGGCVKCVWYLSLKWTAGFDRKGGSQTSFKCHFTKHIAEHTAVETLCYRWFSR